MKIVDVVKTEDLPSNSLRNKYSQEYKKMEKSAMTLQNGESLIIELERKSQVNGIYRYFQKVNDRNTIHQFKISSHTEGERIFAYISRIK